ncbi:Putative amino acid/polyamine transporter I [Colletotrichum destructivum]|uniref:Amino acid/polyamine transporter I n=1 Tax=Colletotrichum destructivum TaxID=34406 RepID=A0AAX4I042_9PEZI|nr:Putative amino acid/polyamine transporter I [Colletotrichum destructivum]
MSRSANPQQLECSNEMTEASHGNANKASLNELGMLNKTISQTAGTVVELRKNFSAWSVLGLGFSMTNSWFGVSTALVAGINSGGPVQLVYGLILTMVVATAIATSLAELSSAMPHAGGQYYWAAMLASPRYSRGASYVTGWVAWAGSLFTCASIALGVGNLCLGCIKMVRPDLEIKPWMTFAAYQIINLICCFFNLLSRLLPLVTSCTLWISIISYVAIILAVPISSPKHRPAEWVFTEFINNTGWPSDSIAYITGLISSNWAFNGLDGAVHMAEEVVNPERVIPIALLGTVVIGFCTAWTFAIAMMVSINDYDSMAATPTGVPILELFQQALGNRVGSIVLLSLIIITGCGCLVASHTWQARLCWSFARDRGLPASALLSQVHQTLQVPLNAHAASCVIVALLGCLYLVSNTAFNSMATACVVLLYLSYSIPVVCLLFRGRSNIDHGPFWLGQLGLVCNFILLAWLLFAFVMFSFPPVYPATTGNMNCVSVVYVVILVIVAIWWVTRARTQYRPAMLRSER